MLRLLGFHAVGPALEMRMDLASRPNLITGDNGGAVKAAIARMAEGASKADVLAATGLTEADWTKAIAALLDRGDVTRTGQKRGTRYHV